MTVLQLDTSTGMEHYTVTPSYYRKKLDEIDGNTGITVLEPKLPKIRRRCLPTYLTVTVTSVSVYIPCKRHRNNDQLRIGLPVYRYEKPVSEKPSAPSVIA